MDLYQHGLFGQIESGLLAVERTDDDRLGDVEQEAQLDGLEQVGVEHQGLVLHRHGLEPLVQRLDVRERLRQRLLRAEHLGVGVHRLLQRLADVRDAFAVGPRADRLELGLDRDGRVLRDLDELRLCRVGGRGAPGTLAEDVDVEQRVRAQAVRAVHGDARDLTGRVEALDDVGRVAQHLALDVRRDAAHGVVRGGVHRDGLGVRLDAQVRARELGDVRELGVDVRGLQVRQVEQHVVLVRARATSLTDLVGHRPGDDVARRQVLDRRGVPLHETLAVGVAQDATLTARGLRQQDAQAREACRVELEELHVLERDAAAVRQRHAVARERVRVRRRLVDLARAARREHDGLGLEDVDLAGRELVGDDARDVDLFALGHVARGEVVVDEQVEHVELVEELDVVLHALLVEGLQDHVPRAVRGVARAAHGGLAVVARVAAEPALVDPALGRAVERQAHLLQVEDRLDGLLGHDLGGVLVDQVVTALDGVERVPLPVVLLDVGQGGAHAALRRAGVGARGVELADHGGAHARRRLERGPHPGPARADDHDVVLMGLHVSRVPSGVRWCRTTAAGSAARPGGTGRT